MEYRNRQTILTLIGLPLLFVGLVAAVLGPVEMYCYYLFSAGGPFYYEGFGFGSFMFANLTCQIAGYYLIAALLIPLGYGHLRLRRWARTLALTLLWAWLVLGVPMIIIFLLILFSSKELTPIAAVIAILLLALTYPLLPVLLLRFYRGHNVRFTFEEGDPNSYWLNRQPLPVLVLGILFVFFALALHVPILFNGMFPLFGTWLTGLEGIIALTIAILSLAFLTWGVVRSKRWAWWGSLIYFILLTLTVVLTLATASYAGLLATMNLPPTEIEFLQGVPAQGFHFALFFGLPLSATLAAILLSRQHFGDSKQALQQTGRSFHAQQ